MEEKFKSQEVLWSQSSAHSSPDRDENPGHKPCPCPQPQPHGCWWSPKGTEDKQCPPTVSKKSWQQLKFPLARINKHCAVGSD